VKSVNVVLPPLAGVIFVQQRRLGAKGEIGGTLEKSMVKDAGRR
jgi:hypothetical protein